MVDCRCKTPCHHPIYMIEDEFPEPMRCVTKLVIMRGVGFVAGCGGRLEGVRGHGSACRRAQEGGGERKDAYGGRGVGGGRVGDVESSATACAASLSLGIQGFMTNKKTRHTMYISS